MAQRRMIAQTITLSDAFLDLPHSTQALYYHLNEAADDEGFINSPKSTMRKCSCKKSDLVRLIDKKFIISFQSGVVVIKHWKIHNFIRSDRLHETKYREERSLLTFDENNAYRLSDKCLTNDGQLGDSCHVEVRLGKVSIENSYYYSRAREPIMSFFQSYFNIRANEIEVEEIFSYVQSWFKPENFEEVIEVLKSAFESALKAGAKNINYIRGIFKVLAQNNVGSPEEYWKYQVEYDRENGK